MDPTQYAAIKSISDPGKARVMMFANGQPAHAPMNAVTAASVHNATAKATPVDADEFGYYDSVSTEPVKATWANIKATLKTYFDPLYDWATVTHAATGKTTPVDADEFSIVDSAASNVIKKLTWANLKATIIAALGTAATQNTGTSGHNLPFLDGTNTWSGAQAIDNTLKVGSGAPQIGTFTVHTGADHNFYTAANFTLSDGISFGSINDANNALKSMEFRAGAFLFSVGGVTVGQWFSRGAPVTKTADFTVATTENNLINNKSGATCTVTLPAASSFSGREILIKTIQAQTVVSASSNVVPAAGGAAGTAILAATAGKWAILISDGTNWIIMAAN